MKDDVLADEEGEDVESLCWTKEVELRSLTKKGRAKRTKREVS